MANQPPPTEPRPEEPDLFSIGNMAIVLVTVLFVGLVLGFVPWIAFSIWPEWAKSFPDKAGLWGDSFGFVNALMSALAFAGVLVTLWMQRLELRLQREEMRLTREEMESTRTEHRRTAEAQEKAEHRLFLAAYMNSLESLRQLSQWRMTADPAVTKPATFPTVEGLVIQARVSQSLQILVRDLEPEIRSLHPNLTRVSEDGSRVWQLERLLGIYLSLRSIVETHRVRSADSSAFEEAINMVQVQLKDLEQTKAYLGSHRHPTVDSLIAKVPSLTLSQAEETRNEERQKYFQRIGELNTELLSFIMLLCYD